MGRYIGAPQASVAAPCHGFDPALIAHYIREGSISHRSGRCHRRGTLFQQCQLHHCAYQLVSPNAGGPTPRAPASGASFQSPAIAGGKDLSELESPVTTTGNFDIQMSLWYQSVP